MSGVPHRPYGGGVYRRRIRLVARAPGRVDGALEDDFHHFRVRLEHDGERVVAARGEAVRFPWTSCPGAVDPLRALEGMPLSRDATAAASHTDPRAQCTHLFDVAALAVTHAAAGRERRQYDVAIPDRGGPPPGTTRAELRRDGQPLLAWDLRGQEIGGPPPFEGVSLRGRAFLDFCRGALDPDGFEAAWVLRRACFISIGRLHDFDAMEGPSAFMALTASACHTFTPGIAEAARRVRGTTRDFSRSPEGPLAEPAPGPRPSGSARR